MSVSPDMINNHLHNGKYMHAVGNVAYTSPLGLWNCCRVFLQSTERWSNSIHDKSVFSIILCLTCSQLSHPTESTKWALTSKPGLSGTFLGVQRRPEGSDDTQSVWNFKRTRACNIWRSLKCGGLHSGPRRSLTLLETAVLLSVSGISVTRTYVRACVCVCEPPLRYTCMYLK